MIWHTSLILEKNALALEECNHNSAEVMGQGQDSVNKCLLKLNIGYDFDSVLSQSFSLCHPLYSIYLQQ